MPQYDFSDGFKQIEAAYNGSGDRVPVFAQLHEFAMQWSGISSEKFYASPQMYVKGILDTVKAFQFDIPDIVWDAYNIEAEAMGVKVFFHEGQSPALDQSRPLIETEKDLARLKPPDPYTSARMPFALESLHIFKELTGVSAPLGFCAPFSLAVLLMGYEKLVMAIYEKPAFVKQVLGFLTEAVIAPYIQAAFKDNDNCPGADGADALSSLPFLTQDMLDEFSIPYILRLRELCDERIFVRNWWGDAYAKDVESFWDQKLKISGGVLEVQDPDLNKVGPERVMAYAELKNLPVILGVDQTLLAEGDVQQIARRVQHYLKVGGGQKRLILYLCNLNRKTPVENIRIAVETVKKYGQYITNALC